MNYEVWQCPSFPIFKKLIKVVVEILNKRIKIGIFKSCDESYRNSWFLVKKKSGAYQIIIIIMKMNKVIMRDANISLNLNEFIENFIKMGVSSLVDYFSGYNNFPLNEISRDMMAIATPLRLLR